MSRHCPGVRAMLLVWVVAAVFAGVVAAFGLHPPAQDEENMSKFPCPEDEVIHPCSCTFDKENGTFTLLCIGLDTTRLDTIFAAEFPFNAFTSLTLQYSNIPVLKEDAFHEKTFQTVVMSANKMTTVENGALKSSYSSLENFYFFEMGGEDYNWPLPDLNQFTVLENIGIFGPYETLPHLESRSLVSAVLTLQELTKLPQDTFSTVPSLETVILDNTKIDSLKADTFLSLTGLETLKISGGKLTELVDSSLAFNSTSLTLVDLHLNNIKTIGKDAFQGLSGSVDVDLSGNQLTELDESVFKTLLEETSGKIDISSNPLVCGCDIYWLIDISDQDLERLDGLNSSCAFYGYSQDVLEDFLEYQCTTSP